MVRPASKKSQSTLLFHSLNKQSDKNIVFTFGHESAPYFALFP